MKRLIIILCGLLSVVSCSHLDDTHGQGGENPLNTCVLPSVVQAGEEALIQWNGFKQTDKIYLVSESGQETEVAIKVFTDSGIMFVIPAGLAEGTYVLILERDTREELGKIEITAAAMPVSGIKIPSSITLGEEMTIEGIGFEEGCSVVFVNEEGKEYVLKAEIVTSGISVMLSKDITAGKYGLYLLQDGIMWMLSPSISVYAGKADKLLKRIDYHTPYSDGVTLKLSWVISRDEPQTLTLYEYLIEDSEETLQAYDLYESNAEGHFELTHDGFESSNDLAMSYTRNFDGVVIGSDVLIYGNDQTTAFTWTYDADGYLTDISSPARSFRSLEYTGGNLTTFRNTSFEYGDPELVNHPFAPDVVWAYMALMESNDPFVYFPFFLGWYTKSSAQLPDALILPSPTGTGTVRNELSYVFDEDGYVVKMTWEASEIDFIY